MMGTTPLHIAAERGHINFVHLLLSHGALVNVQDNLYDVPLFKQREYVALSVMFTFFISLFLLFSLFLLCCILFCVLCSLLCVLCFVFCGCVCDSGQTPLHLAAKENQKEIVKILKQHGANSDILDYRGRSPFSLTASEDIRNILSGNILIHLL
jgi:ankyrin repeat protein